MTDNRTADRVSRTLMIVGTALAAVSAATWMADALPRVPEWMLRLAVYKLAFASGAGLLIAGAVIRRSLGLSRASAPPAPGQLEPGAFSVGRSAAKAAPATRDTPPSPASHQGKHRQ